jgi:hypothetical protein
MFRTRRLQLESLEDRVTPASLKFTAPIVSTTTTTQATTAVRTVTYTAPTTQTSTTTTMTPATMTNSYAPIGVGGTSSGSSGGPVG